VEQPPRRANRFLFSAFAEIVPENCGPPLSTRVKELSLYGCYLELNASLAKGTRVLVKIFSEEDYFEARGTVLYSHPNLGMGLAFREVKPQFLQVLQKWLLSALQEKLQPPPGE